MQWLIWFRTMKQYVGLWSHFIRRELELPSRLEIKNGGTMVHEHKYFGDRSIPAHPSTHPFMLGNLSIVKFTIYEAIPR